MTGCFLQQPRTEAVFLFFLCGMSEQTDILIIGAGLCGLTAAYELTKRGRRPLLLEADSRPGGRIHSVPAQAGPGPFEMGATWFGEKHGHLNALMRGLGVGRFEQYAEGQGRYEVMSFLPAQSFELPYSSDPYYRVRGGSAALIDALAEKVGREQIRLQTKVVRITDQSGTVEVAAESGPVFRARTVLLTLPPKLAEASLLFEPDLPGALRTAMRQTHTWMSDSIKFWVEYARPFWREKGLAGMAMSQTGIVQEVHDHTNYEENSYALMGFLAGKAYRLDAAGREAEVIRHLQRLFGEEAGNYLQYEEKVWKAEPLTTTADVESLSYHPAYGHPAFQQSYWNGKLWLSGTETSPVYGGYMEGAVYAGQKSAKQLAAG